MQLCHVTFPPAVCEGFGVLLLSAVIGVILVGVTVYLDVVLPPSTLEQTHTYPRPSQFVHGGWQSGELLPFLLRLISWHSSVETSFLSSSGAVWFSSKAVPTEEAGETLSP